MSAELWRSTRVANASASPARSAATNAPSSSSARGLATAFDATPRRQAAPGGAVQIAERSVRGRELALLGRAGQRGRRRRASRDDLRDVVEVAGADLALVARGGVAALLGGELGLLQLRVRGHAAVAVAVGQVEHRVRQGVEAGKRHELE